jgi:hypothetical protein
MHRLGLGGTDGVSSLAHHDKLRGPPRCAMAVNCSEPDAFFVAPKSGLRVTERSLSIARASSWQAEPSHWEAYTHHQHIWTIGALRCCDAGGGIQTPNHEINRRIRKKRHALRPRLDAEL